MISKRSKKLISVAVCLAFTAGITLDAVGTAGAASSAARRAPFATRIEIRGRNFDYEKVRGLSRVRFGANQIVRQNFMVPMKMQDNGMDVRMYVEVVRPKAPGRYPTILELSPYHGTLADRTGTRILPGPKYTGTRPHYLDSDEDDKTLGLAGYFAPRGYAVVFADLRGTGRSEGCLDHLGPKDASDSKIIVEWAARQPWSNGRVGMTGHSYVGSTPQMAAAQNPRGLKTIVPSAGLAAMYHHKFQQGVPYFLQWVGPAAAYEQLAIQRHLLPQLGDQYGDSFGEGMEWFACGLPSSTLITGEAYASGQYVEWDAERDHRKGATRSTIPMFAVHGTHDNAARIPALDWFDARRNRPYDKAWIGQWDHGSNVYPVNRTCPQHVPTPCEDDQWTKALHAWFDKHLARRKVNTGPSVEVFLNNKTVWQPPRWPPLHPRRIRMHLREGGKLTRTPAATQSSDSFVGDDRGQFLPFSTGSVRYQTAPLKRPVQLAGVPRMRLKASVVPSKKTVHIIPTLYDLAPDGEFLRISKASFAINPELRDGITERKPVVPGQEMTMRLRGMDQAHVLKKGHRLILIITTSHPDKVATFAEGAVTIYQGGKDGTRLLLPVKRRVRLRRDRFTVIPG